jgi:hypothetical protein
MARSPEGTAPQPTPQPPYPKRSPQRDEEAPEKKYPDTTERPKKARDPDEDRETYKTWQKLSEEANRRRQPWIPMWQAIYELVLPQRESFFDIAPGQPTTDLIYDETAVVGLPRLASRLTSGFFPEAGELFTLAFGHDAPDHLKGLDGQLKIQALTLMIHEAWQNSNLPVEISEGMIDFAVGTMNLAQEPGAFPGDVVFKTVPPTNIAILPGAGGKVVGWFQWRKKQPLEEVWKEFGKKGQFPDKFMKDLKSDPRRELVVHTATWDTSTVEKYSWKQVAILSDYNAVIYENDLEGDGACPWSTTRWSRVGLDVWGRGCVMLVMPAIKTCNLTVQMILENAELALGGVWTYDDDGVFNPDNIVLAPGTFIPKSKEGKVEALQSAAQFNVADLVLADQRMNIKKGLFIDEMDTQGKTPKSAFEIQQRLAEIARDLSAPGARLVHECLIQQVNRTIHIFEQQGILDSMGLRVNGKQIKMTVKSPLLRGQDQVELNELMQWGQMMDALFGPNTAAMTLNRATTIPYISKRNGIPMTLIRSDEEIKADLAKAQAGAMAAQAAAPAGPEGAQQVQGDIAQAATG